MSYLDSHNYFNSLIYVKPDLNIKTKTQGAKLSTGCGAVFLCVSCELINDKFFKSGTLCAFLLSVSFCLLIRRLKPASCIMTVGYHKSWQTASVTLSLLHTESLVKSVHSVDILATHPCSYFQSCQLEWSSSPYRRNRWTR